jgi:hypothetical protein
MNCNCFMWMSCMSCINLNHTNLMILFAKKWQNIVNFIWYRLSDFCVMIINCKNGVRMKLKVKRGRQTRRLNIYKKWQLITKFNANNILPSIPMMTTTKVSPWTIRHFPTQNNFIGLTLEQLYCRLTSFSWPPSPLLDYLKPAFLKHGIRWCLTVCKELGSHKF